MKLKANIIFIQSADEFSKEEKIKITKLVKKIYSKAAIDLDIKSLVNFTFYRFGNYNGGFTQAKDWIAVTLPKGELDLIDLEPMLFHELHHIARGYCSYLENANHYLLNSLFAEGLATSYEAEHCLPERKMTHNKYTDALVKKWLPEMKKDLYNIETYDYPGWFRGRRKPKQLGYKIGTYLTDQIKKNYPQMSHKDLAKKDAKELLKLSNVKF